MSTAKIQINAKFPIFFSTLIKFGFLKSFIKFPNLNFTEILPVGAAMIHADGQTDGWMDVTKLIGECA
jgi:hypothetical protein